MLAVGAGRSDFMNALVVFESMFGNTQAVANAVAEGLSERGGVRVVEVTDAPHSITHDVDLLVVGGPTHAFSMTRANTRQSAVNQGADSEKAAQPGIREWIADVAIADDVPVATFDTKVVKPHLPGSAAHAADRKLRHRGLHHVARPETFYVTGTTGDLVDGELSRAKEWGATLVR